MSKIKNFTIVYLNNLFKSIYNTDFKNLDISARAILKTIKRNGSIYVCGNGGSAAIANHYVVDFLKFFRENTTLKPKIFSLSNNIEAAFSNAARRSQQNNILHVIKLLNRIKIGTTAICESKRSQIPPCPGINDPLSFMDFSLLS